jgi:hypothetical protein
MKMRVLAALSDRPIRSGRLLRWFHDALCFLRAYPDDPAVLRLVEETLGEFTGRLKGLQAAGPGRQVGALNDSGAAGTTVYGPFSYPIARWLVDRFPEAVEIDWDEPDAEDCVGSILSLFGGLAVEDALVEVDTSYRSWLAAAKGSHAGSDLRWLLDRLDQALPDTRVRHTFYDRIRLSLCWDLRDGRIPDARSKASEVSPVFFQEGPLVQRRVGLRLSLPGVPVPVRVATPREAIELIDVARAALAVRHRETHAFGFANPNGALVADLGRGVRIAWFGVLPEHRLPLRAHFGFLILKNEMPIGYGDASLLFEWIDGGGGINIFEAFRHGEAAFIFARYAAFLYQHLNVRAFHLSRWDIGYGNPEGIESGAFWFYYKLGFRPKSEELRRLAAQEYALIKRRSGYRSSPETLGKLCQVGMFAAFDDRLDPAVRDFETRRIGQRASALLAHADPDRLMSRVAANLGASQWRGWLTSERLAFERLAPVLALIPDLGQWPVQERYALGEAVRAKTGPRETEYLYRLRGLPRFRAALLELAKA